MLLITGITLFIVGLVLCIREVVTAIRLISGRVASELYWTGVVLGTIGILLVLSRYL
jgi:hypothetical protein